ncbi:MAG: hypothetical protein RIR16_61 [Actinomycetota bacterium]
MAEVYPNQTVNKTAMDLNDPLKGNRVKINTYPQQDSYVSRIGPCPNPKGC